SCHGDAPPANATITASSTHAAASTAAAEPSASLPTRVADRPRSVRILASTGKAVIDIAVLMKSTKTTGSDGLYWVDASQIAVAPPRMKGSTVAPTAMPATVR